MSERPAPPPEGQLITAALERFRPKMSVPEAARRADISDSRWRQIAQGYLMVSGNPSPVTGPAETIARMARVVGVTSVQLRKAGRADAADALQELEFDEKLEGKTTDEIIDAAEVIAATTEATLKRLGRDLDTRQRRVLSRHAMRLLEDLEDIRELRKTDT